MPPVVPKRHIRHGDRALLVVNQRATLVRAPAALECHVAERERHAQVHPEGAIRSIAVDGEIILPRPGDGQVFGDVREVGRQCDGAGQSGIEHDRVCPGTRVCVNNRLTQAAHTCVVEGGDGVGGRADRWCPDTGDAHNEGGYEEKAPTNHLGRLEKQLFPDKLAQAH